MTEPRYLVVTADDFGIGPATSQGILDLAAEGLVTATVLLVTSPHAEEAMRAWRRQGSIPELGWHPCLTLDAPVLPAGRVPSLVGHEGRFWPLRDFLRRLCQGRIRTAEIEAELRAQYERFRELSGAAPALVNTHHHVQIFPPVGDVLLKLLASQRPLPYLRRVQEPWPLLIHVSGARLKRTFLTLLGRRFAYRQRRAGLPGNDWLAGVTDLTVLRRPDHLGRWLSRMPGRVVELTCHPGYLDTTLPGRDGTADGWQIERRVFELHLLQRPSFREACHRAGFTLTTTAGLRSLKRRGSLHAA